MPAKYQIDPRELSVYTTERCNLGCWFCRRTISGEGDASDMAPPMLEKALAKFPTLKSACLAGFGEPLLNPHIYEMIRLLRRRGLFVSMVTNGILLGKHLDRLAASDISMISVSLNASNADDYKAMGGVGAFDVVCKNIKAVVDRGFCRFHVSFVCDKQNYAKVPELLHLCHGLGVKIVDLLNLLPHDDVDRTEFMSRVITEDDAEILAFFDDQKKAPLASIVNRWPVPLRPSHNPSLCDSPWVHVGFDGSGLVGGCRRVNPPSHHGVHIDDASAWYADAHHHELRAALAGECEMPEVCQLCWGNWSKP